MYSFCFLPSPLQRRVAEVRPRRAGRVQAMEIERQADVVELNPDDAIGSVRHARLLLVGFGEVEAATISRCLRRLLPNRAPFAILNTGIEIDTRDIELAIMRLSEDDTTWRLLERFSREGIKSVILVRPDELLERSAELRKANDVLILPWTEEELVVRVAKLLDLTERKSASPENQTPPVRSKVLVADDDPSVVSLIAALCRNLKAEVRTAQDGVETLQEARRWRPDLLILDIMMPNLGGMETLNLVRLETQLHNTRVLLLTGCGEPGTIARGAELGADDYVVKPLRPLEITRRIKRLLLRPKSTIRV